MAEKNQQKLKLSQKKFTRRSVVGGVAAGAVAAGITGAMNFFSLSMDIFLGRGEAQVTENANMAGANTSYYAPVTAEEAIAASDEVALAIAQEGEVLLKNAGAALPLERGSAVTPFGYRYLEPVYSGGGSGNVNTESSRIVSAQAALAAYFSVNEEVEKALTEATAMGLDTNGYTAPQEEGGFEGGKLTIAEFDPAVYGGLEASMAGTTGIVFIGRAGNEGGDVFAPVPGSPLDGTSYADGTAHQLQLTEYEKEMIRISKANCDKTVVVLETSNTMEIADLAADEGDLAVDAILLAGVVGNKGFEAMGQILCGEVNPSGRTIDTWATDVMAAPAMSNFGNYEYRDLYLLTGGFPNPVGDPTEMNYLEYEEGIYVGYRWYETVDATGGSFTVFGEEGKSYDDAVIYPFGYGLSYDAEFTQAISNVRDGADSVELTVTVTNTGTRAGKTAVQVYVHPPYTDFDAQNRIEKSACSLVAFDKTEDIEPGASVDVTLTVVKEELASYSYTYENPDGTTGAYFLEAGDYELSVNENAHVALDSTVFTIASDVWYDSDNPRKSEILAQAVLDNSGEPTGTAKAAAAGYGTATISAHNLFGDMTEHMEGTSMLTRADGALVDTTNAPTEEERTVIPEGFYYSTASDGTMTLEQMDLSTDPVMGNVPESRVYVADMPVTGADRVLTLADLRGADYNDPAWDQLLDQLDLSDSNLYLALAASYDQTAGIESIGKTATVDFDGPQGIVGSITDSTEYCAYPAEPVLASTFNVRLAERMGDAVGQEASVGGINSWYAPACNIHRCAFGGRNFEYYSEDPLVSGDMAASVIQGCSNRGLVTTVKHFALNDEELYNNDRSRVSIWADEQAIREIYLRPFEIAIKEPMMDLVYLDANGDQQTKVMRGALGVMGCMNYWGTQWGGADYALLTELLRHEWGFEGMVITDMVMNAGSNSVDQCLRSGSDTWMAWGDSFTGLIEDTETATGVSVIRRAVKNMSYMVANSRAMDGIAPGSSVKYATSPWRIGLGIFDAAVVAGLAALVATNVRRAKDAREHPENYQPDEVKKA